MKIPTPKYLRALMSAAPAALVSLVLGTFLRGQVVTAPTVKQSASVKDETIELSPFVVGAEDDSGYAPTETLSGTRLRTQTKNVASAMSIVTSDLLRDIGAMN